MLSGGVEASRIQSQYASSVIYYEIVIVHGAIIPVGCFPANFTIAEGNFLYTAQNTTRATLFDGRD